MQPLISVIVPIYNSQASLRECIRSVLAQTHTNFELFLIDDGSSDQSRRICETYAAGDSRIRFLSQKHAGVSAARNTGIQSSRGKYLFFLDSDDAVHPCLLETLSALLERHSATMATEYFSHTQSPEKQLRLWQSADGKIAEDDFTCLSNQAALDSLIREKPFSELGGIGGYLILKSAIPPLQFDEKLSHGEDTLFIYSLLAGGADMIFLKRDWYCYRTHAQQHAQAPSPLAQRSLYVCQTSIRDAELERGRIKNAVIREGKLLNLLALWYAESKKSRDDGHACLLLHLAESEKKWSHYSQVVFFSKLSLFLSLRLRPLYWLMHRLWALIEKRLSLLS